MMETVAIFAPSPIIPVIDERIDTPRDTPKEQQQKIVAYNELLEEIYQRKTELVTFEGMLAAMKVEIEGDIAHLRLKSSEETGKAERRWSGATAIAAFVPSSSPPSSNGITSGAAIANLMCVSGATKNVKSRGKGKKRQERARLNGKDLRYKKGGRIHLEEEHYDGYNDELVDDEDHDEETDESGEDESEGEVFEQGVPVPSN